MCQHYKWMIVVVMLKMRFFIVTLDWFRHKWRNFQIIITSFDNLIIIKISEVQTRFYHILYPCKKNTRAEHTQNPGKIMITTIYVFFVIHNLRIIGLLFCNYEIIDLVHRNNLADIFVEETREENIRFDLKPNCGSHSNRLKFYRDLLTFNVVIGVKYVNKVMWIASKKNSFCLLQNCDKNKVLLKHVGRYSTTKLWDRLFVRPLLVCKNSHMRK